MPPFPQLLHVKDEASPFKHNNSDPNAEDELEEDDDNDVESHASPGAGVGSSGVAKDKMKERKPHATRRRVVQSCSECRRRKIKCDKK